MTEKTKSIIALRQDGKSYDEIVVILGCTMKSVRYVCQEYHCTYHDIEESWRRGGVDGKVN